MFDSINSKTHYKMYKKGRFWLFAGVTLLSWQMSTATAQAENVSQDKTTNTQTNSTTVTPKATPTNEVVLDTANKTAPTTTENDKTQSSPVTADSSVDTATQKPSATAALPNTATTEQTVAPNKDTTSSGTPKTDSNQVEQPDNPTPDSSATTASPDQSNSTVATGQSPTSTPDQLTTVPNSNTPQLMKMSRNNLARMATTTEDGGWSVTDDGAGNVILHFAGGTTLSTAGRSYDQPWRAGYASTITEIDFDGPVTAGKDLSQIFADLYNLTTVNNANLLDTSNTTDMSYLFGNDAKLTAINGIENWNTANVIDMHRMFFSNWKLASLAVNTWDTSKVTNMSATFEQTGLTSLNLSNWKTSKVTDLNSMFAGDSVLTNLNLLGPGWDTKNVTDMSGLFSSTQITNLLDNVRSWNTSNVTDMNGMFLGANLATWDISNWDTSKVTSMTNMLSGNPFTTLDLNDWDTSNVTNMSGLFNNCTKLTKIDIDKWNTKNVTLIASMFRSDLRLQSLDLNDWDTSNITDFSYAFMDCQQLTSLIINNWDTNNVTNASGIFDDLLKLTNLNLDHWNTTNFNNTNYLFAYSSIPTITFGPQVTLATNCELSIATINGVPAGYTGNWVNTADATDILTDAELIAAYATPRKTTLTYTWQHLPTMTLKNSTFKLGSTENWSATNGIVAATDEYGKATDSTNVMLTNNSLTAIDKQALGTYLVTFNFAYMTPNGISYVSRSTNVTVYGISLKEQTISKSTTAAWSSVNNVQQAIDSTGKPVTNFNWLNINTPYMNKPGTYTVTYTIDDFTTTSTVIVTSAAKIIAKSIAVKWQSTWNPTDGIVSATDENGDKITDYSKLFNFNDVNTNKLGVYTVTYYYDDAINYAVNSGTVSVVVYGIALKQRNISKVTTENWNPADNVVSATDLSGNVLTGSELSITRSNGGDVHNLTKPGTYTINYALGNYITSTTVTVFSNAKVTSRRIVYQLGTDWDYTKGIVTAYDENNQIIADLSVLKISDTVDTQTPGVYTATYSYTDAAGNVTSSAPAQVIVYGLRLDQDSFTKSTTANWNPADHISAAVDKTGKTIPAQDIAITIPAASRNLTLPGTYDLTYSLDNTDTVTAKMTVTNQAQLVGQTTAIKLGSDWPVEAGIKTALDENGQPLSNFNQITESDNVNPDKLGIYDVTYTYTDAAGNQTTAPTVHVIVYGLVLKQPNLTKSTTGKLNLVENVSQALDRTGNFRTGSEVTITAPSDNQQLTKPGIATVAYTLDDYTVPATVSITNAAKLVGQVTSVKLGTIWQPADGLKTALDENGHPLTDLSQMTVTGNLDTSQPGIYSMTYHYVDAAGNITNASPINVIVYGIQLTETNKTLTPTAHWQPLSNVKRAITPTGSTASTADIQVNLTDSNGQVVTDLTQPGQYLVSYRLADTTVTMQLTVDSLAAINAHNVTLTAGDTWNAARGLTIATAFDGQPLSLDQLTITGTVDTNTIGTYPVSYSYTDGENQVTTKTILVTVIAKSATGNHQPQSGQKPQRPIEKMGQLADQSAPEIKSNPVQLQTKTMANPSDLTESSKQSAKPAPSLTDQSAKQRLPQTNEVQPTAIHSLGLVLFAFSGLLFGLSRYYRRQRH